MSKLWVRIISTDDALLNSDYQREAVNDGQNTVLSLVMNAGKIGNDEPYSSLPSGKVFFYE